MQSWGMKNLIIRVPDELHKQLRQIALDDATSLQQIALKLFERLVREHEKKPKK